MFLARLILNPMSREVQRDIRNPHELHRTLMSVFPETGRNDARATFGLLHRLDVDPRSGSVIVNAQSQVAVDWTALPQGYLKSVPENPLVKEIGSIYGRIQSGHVFQFRLRANPTKSELPEAKAGVRGRRIPIIDPDEQIEWLRRQAERNGFELLSSPKNPDHPLVEAVPEGPVRFRKSRTDRAVTLQSVNFRGFLRVTDAGRFRAALAEGIGRGRAYGFGLLQLGPARMGMGIH